jgi:hypothetical protein
LLDLSQAFFADTPSNQLGSLPSEIEDEDQFLVGDRQRHSLRHNQTSRTNHLENRALYPWSAPGFKWQSIQMKNGSPQRAEPFGKS